LRERKVGGRRLSQAAQYLAVTFLYAIMMALLDSIGLLLATGSVPRPTLTLLLFLEGGLGLIISVAIALSSGPSAARLGETLFGTSPWSLGAQKHAEKASLRWMLVSACIIAIGFIVSAL
jgi:hypothetical protein